jgi:LysR family transcriptional regulator, chromosome initiation inhibitor
MRWTTTQLEALEAVCRLGTFAEAARELHLTPGALSQRIHALEADLGEPVVVRTQPAVPTEAGKVVLGIARKYLLAQAEAESALLSAHGRSADPVSVRIAINADSVSTWFRPVVTQIAERTNWLLDLHIEDQDWSSRMLRDARVMAAVTTDPRPIQGCRAERLGTMHYIPVASRALLARTGLATPADLLRVPTLKFDRRDTLTDDLLNQLGVEGQPPTHFIPSNREYLDAVHSGLGWSVLPSDQIAEEPYRSDLVRIMEPYVVSVSLYWHRWRTPSETLDDLSAMVRKAAASLTSH